MLNRSDPRHHQQRSAVSPAPRFELCGRPEYSKNLQTAADGTPIQLQPGLTYAITKRYNNQGQFICLLESLCQPQPNVIPIGILCLWLATFSWDGFKPQIRHGFSTSNALVGIKSPSFPQSNYFPAGKYRELPRPGRARAEACHFRASEALRMPLKSEATPVRQKVLPTTRVSQSTLNQFGGESKSP